MGPFQLTGELFLYGTTLSALGYAYKASKQISATKRVDERGRTVYAIEGPLFFGSATTFARLVDAREESNNKIVWDFAGCKVWDSTAVSALDDAAAKCRERGKAVVLRHLSPSCAALLRQCGDLVEVNVEEDPIYAVAADYDDDALTKTSPMTIQVPEISKHEDQLEDWQQSALRRQFKR